MQMVEQTMRRSVVLTNNEGLVGNVEAGCSLGCSKHEIVEFKVLCRRNKAISRMAALEFRRANFDLSKNQLRGIPWVRALEGKGAQESLSVFE